MSKRVRNWLILGTLVAVTILAVLWATSILWFPRNPFGPRLRPLPENVQWDIELFYTVETVVSTINMTLSIILLLLYVNIYAKTRSEFTIGLMIFSAILLVHAFLSIPLVHQAFGFYEFGLGPFAMLPDLFTFAALIVLLYLTAKY
jgi:hypothetical protein